MDTVSQPDLILRMGNQQPQWVVKSRCFGMIVALLFPPGTPGPSAAAFLWLCVRIVARSRGLTLVRPEFTRNMPQACQVCYIIGRELAQKTLSQPYPKLPGPHNFYYIVPSRLNKYCSWPY
jgi:hypothetical protein